MRARFDAFVLDTDERLLSRHGAPVHLTPKALSLLECLLERRHSAVAKGELLGRLWPSTFVTEASLTSVVKELRKALGDSARVPRFVRGVRGYGYAFCADAQSDGGPSPALCAARTEKAPPASREFRVEWQEREIALVEGENLLGRTHQAMVWVDEPSVSRHHAVIRIADGRAVVEDCGSRNGTWLRGERIDGPRELQPGDEIWLGKAALRICVYAAEVSTGPMSDAPRGASPPAPPTNEPK